MWRYRTHSGVVTVAGSRVTLPMMPSTVAKVAAPVALQRGERARRPG